MLEYIRNLFVYDAWANSLALSSVREQGDAGPDARRILAHIFAAEEIWFARLLGDTPTLQPWTELSLDQCARRANELPKKWSEYLHALGSDELGDVVAYTNTKGEPFETRTVDILHHVIAHSAYHRGQVALQVRSAGLTPAATDYILYVRTHGG
jgi:uncharacterized damage-inducible protein DinB